jgi:hypothetical protein
MPEKITGYPFESLAKKNVFAEKYAEIRSFDGTDLINVIGFQNK